VFNSGEMIEWVYTASGQKLRKIAIDTLNNLTLKNYVNGFKYDNKGLEFFSTEEGRVVKESNGFTREYFLKDHLGNTRVVFNAIICLSQ